MSIRVDDAERAVTRMWIFCCVLCVALGFILGAVVFVVIL